MPYQSKTIDKIFHSVQLAIVLRELNKDFQSV